MTQLSVALDRSGGWYRPGEPVTGNCSWRLDEDAASLDLHLLWYTEGKGSQDVEVVASERVERPGAAGSRTFSLQVPVAGPYSFAGTLIALSWAVEAVVEPGGLTERLTILVGPRASEVRLSAIADEPSPG